MYAQFFCLFGFLRCTHSQLNQFLNLISMAFRLFFHDQAHILEHELFKGSKHFQKKFGNDIWTAMNGARLNASTSKDRTEFNSTMRVDLLDKALEIEADRLRAPLLTGLEKEYVVVRNEYERGKCSDASLLREEVYKAAFPLSSAGVPTIGSKQDINDILFKHEADLRKFHKDNYCPANCVIVLSGQFDPDQVLAKINECFGDIPAGKSLRDIDEHSQLDFSETEHDDPQRGQRSVEIAGVMPLAMLAFRTPNTAVCREAIVLEVLSYWISAGESGAFADILSEFPDEIQEIQAEYERGHGTGTLFGVWIVPVSGGNSRQRIQRFANLVLSKLRSSDIVDEDSLRKAKNAVDRAWRQQRDSCASYTQSIVESVSRANSPFDVLERHHILQTITLDDVKKIAATVFVPYRMVIGRVLPELSQYSLSDPPCTPYKVSGIITKIPDVKRKDTHNVPYEEAIVDESGVYILDPEATMLSMRVHIPAADTVSDAELELSAAMATLGVKLESGLVMSEGDLQKAYQECGATAMVGGNHAGLDISLDVPRDANNINELVSLLHRGLTHPSVTSRDFKRKRTHFQNQTVGADYEVNTTAAKIFSQSIFHENNDPRARLAGVKESQLLKNVTKQKAMTRLNELATQPAWVTCIAPTQKQINLVKQTFAPYNGTAPQHDITLKTPGVSPYANQIVKCPMPGKTSCTMLLGVACDITPSDERSLPLSLGVDVLGGSFTSRLMQRVREDAGLTYGSYANIGLVDPSTSTLSCSATFAPENVDQGVALTRSVVQKWREEGITAEELEAAKIRGLGSVALAADSASAVCSSLHASRIHHANPAQRCAQLPARIKKVNLDQVNSAIASLPKFTNFVCVCAGSM